MITITEGKQGTQACKCCDNTSIFVSGDVKDNGRNPAFYTASWTPNGAEHGMSLFVFVAPYEQDEYEVALFPLKVERFKKGTGFQCIEDQGPEPWPPGTLVLSVSEALAHRDINAVFHWCDHITAEDSRIDGALSAMARETRRLQKEKKRRRGK